MYGTPAQHIRKTFESNIFDHLGLMESFQQEIINDLSRVGVKGPLEQFGLTHDPFSFALSQIPRSDDARGRLETKRADLFGLKTILEGDLQSLQDRNIFRVLHQPKGLKEGFGTVVLNRADALGEVGRSAPNQAQVAGMLNAALTNIQVDRYGSLRYSGTAYTNEFLTGQAEHFVNMRNQGVDHLAGKTVFYFDTETTGVHRQSRPWQISGATYRDGAQVGDALDIRFADVMDGMWPSADGPVRFEQFYDRLKGGGVEWTDDITAGLKTFLRTANQADVLVAQNAQFDVRQIFSLIADTYSGQDEELIGLSREFVAKMKDPLAIKDTRAMAALLLGDLATDETGKRFSMDNILARSSFVDDVLEIEGVDILKMLDDEGRLHDAATDKRILYYFDQMLDRAAQGEDVLRGLDKPNAAVVRALAKGGGALVPGAKMTAGVLGKGHPDIGKTYLQYGIEQGRKFDSASVADVTIDRLFEGMGRYGRWADSILGDSETGGRLVAESGFEAIQQAALKANMPFAGLSAEERLLSTLLGRAVPYNDSMEGISGTLRNAIGEQTGGSIFKMGSEVKIYGQTNLALPVQALENEKIARILGIGEGVLDKGPQSVSDLIAGRLSFYEYTTEGGVKHQDASLILDAFRDKHGRVLKGAALKSKATSLVRALEEAELIKPGSELAREILENPQMLAHRGVQIGDIGTGNMTDELFEFAQRYGADADDKSPHTVRVAIGRRIKSGDESYLTVSPAIISGEGTGRFGGIADDAMYANMKGLQQMMDLVDANGSQKGLASALWFAAKTDNAEKAKRLYERIQWLRTGGRIPKILGGVVAGAITMKIGYGRYKMRQYDETMDFQGYEEGGFYNDYREEMGLHQLPSGYEREHINALATARVVGNLDRNKIGHTTMGSNKYDHLFA